MHLSWNMPKGRGGLQDAQKKAKEEDKRKSAAAAEVAKAKESMKGGNKKQGDKGATKDPDPDGVELASTSAPLDEASTLLLTLREHAGDRLKTHTLSFEVTCHSTVHDYVIFWPWRGSKVPACTAGCRSFFTGACNPFQS